MKHVMKKLNFGCGTDLKEGWDNVDIQKSPKITKSFNFNRFPYPIKDNTYDYIYLKNVLEHVNEPEKVISELRRISKKQGSIEIIVPHYTNKGAYSDLEHKHYFNEVAFLQLENKETRINKNKEFKILEIKITPTIIGKLLPKFLREKLSLFVNGLLSQIIVKLAVIK